MPASQPTDYTIAVVFPPEILEGEDAGRDVGAMIRENFHGDVTVDVDAAGTVTGYTVTLHYADQDMAVATAFAVTELLVEMGVHFEVDVGFGAAA